MSSVCSLLAFYSDIGVLTTPSRSMSLSLIMAHLDYLDRTGVQRELQKALKNLVSTQPEDPISFLVKHFDHLIKPKRDATLICSELLQETNALNPGEVDSAVYKTFVLLSTDSDNGDDTILMGKVQGASANKLTRELCCNIDPHVADSLLGKLHVPSEAVLSYDTFKSIITTSLNLQAFLRMAKDVFVAIDTQQTGAIRRQIGEDILSRLSGALSANGSNHKESVELARTSLSPSEIATIVQRGTQREGTMSLKEFQKLAAQMFVNHLPIQT